MKIVNGLFKLLYMPICRTYSKYIVGNKPADSVYRFLCSLQYLKVYHTWPNLNQPKLFSEKIWSRMLHDRNTHLTLLNDKLLVRDFVKSKAGSEYLIPLLWKGDNPELIPFDDLPSKFVIKATHGCSYNILVNDKSKIDRRQTQLQLMKWLKTNYCESFLLGIEWGYKNIKPRIIIEEFIEENGRPPVDYKFWCFSGRVESISVHFDRFGVHSTLAFDRNFELGGLTFDLPIYRGNYERPSNCREMIQVAELLAKDFDFIRVDLYSVKNKIYFGEMTPYPGGVTHKFEPKRVDHALGMKWKMKNE